MKEIIQGLNLEFDWDTGNVFKNECKHDVSWSESEEVFFNDPLVLEDKKHSNGEKRYWSLGETNKRKLLQVTFTLRAGKLRIISARSMSRKERKIYEQTKRTT